ncbi:MAG TPA: hypothetical protein P5277_00025 [Candidatus Paceibacterota bacterium]|nr:hypothetical protein [Candidatus Paceibacterota bacterium]
MVEYIVVSEKDFNRARFEIDKIVKSGKKAAFLVRDEEFNRKIMEKTLISMIVGLESDEFETKKDKLRQRDSGFNEVLAKIAHDRGISVGIDVAKLIKLSEKEMTWQLGRILQNVKLCNKYNVKIVFVNSLSSNKFDLMSLGLSLGMSTLMAKYAVDNSIKLK